MDISALLPLILGGNKDATALLAAMNAMKNRASTQSVPSSAPEQNTTDPRAELIKSVVGNSANPETINALTAMMNAQSNGRKAQGFTPILPFVCNDILGKMDKFMSRKR